jgi:hypothetical protein
MEGALSGALRGMDAEARGFGWDLQHAQESGRGFSQAPSRGNDKREQSSRPSAKRNSLSVLIR